MRKLKKLSALAVASAMIISSLTACGSNSETTNNGTKEPSATGTTETKKSPELEATKENPLKVKLTIWGPTEEQSTKGNYKNEGGLQGFMCEEFNKEHPEWDITFEYKSVSESTCATEIQKDAEAAGDVIMFVSDQIGKLTKAGVLYPIADVYGGKEVKEAQSKAALSSAQVYNEEAKTDILYGVPFTPNTWFMYYNKSMYTEDDVKSLETMMSKDLGKGVYNFSTELDDAWYNSTFFLTAGCRLFGPDGTDEKQCDFNNENGVEAAKYMMYLNKQSKANKFLEAGDKNYITYFKEGKLGAACSGSWDAKDIKEALGDNYAAAKLPTIKINGEDKQMMTFGNYKLIGVNQTTKYPIIATQLACYLGGEKCQKLRFDDRLLGTTLESLANADAADASMKAIVDQCNYTVDQPSIPAMSNFWEPAKAIGTGIISGDITEKNIQSKLDSFVENLTTTLK